MKDNPASLGITYGQVRRAVIGFLDRDYCCKSVPIQIPQQADLVSIRPAVDRTRVLCV